MLIVILIIITIALSIMNSRYEGPYKKHILHAIFLMDLIICFASFSTDSIFGGVIWGILALLDFSRAVTYKPPV